MARPLPNRPAKNSTADKLASPTAPPPDSSGYRTDSRRYML
jgi:hypothetical protein